MSFRQNVALSYASQAYVTILGFAAVPVYLKLLGQEAMGLIGFFATLQACFMLLDLGLSPLLSRETAQFRAGKLRAETYVGLLRFLELIFVGSAVFFGAALIVASSVISADWLNAEHLERHDVTLALQAMAAVAALRWVMGLFRSTITGSELVGWLSVTNALFATVRSLLVIPFLLFVSSEVTSYFWYQAGAAILEVAVLLFKARSIRPSTTHVDDLEKTWRYVKTLLPFCLSLSTTAAMWIAISQIDKILLSKVLSLSDFAAYSVAVLAAGVVNICSQPMTSALLPRLASLHASGEEQGLLTTFRRAMRLISALCSTIVTVLVLYSQELLFSWTGSAEIALSASNVLSWTALGNGILACSAFAYYLQYAHGKLRLHFYANLSFLIALIPAVLFVGPSYGGIGVAIVWCTCNALYFLVWMPLILDRFANVSALKWILDAVALPALLSSAAVFAGWLVIPLPDGRVTAFFTIVAVTMLCGFLTVTPYLKRLMSAST